MTKCVICNKGSDDTELVTVSLFYKVCSSGIVSMCPKCLLKKFKIKLPFDKEKINR